MKTKYLDNMRLKSLYIEEYKNIRKQTFDFSSNTGYIALIGLNGSGKSNLLEAIGLIFNGIFNKKKIPFDYTIVYEHNGKEFSRKKKSATMDGKRAKNEEMFYPSPIIACYSGEDLRLWHMAFEDYYMHYFKKAIDNLLSIPELIYISKYCWSIALIALMSSEDVRVKAFLEINLGITDLEKVEVSFEFAEVNNFKDHQALKWINRIKEECLDTNGKASIKSLLSYDVPLLPNKTKESTLFHYLYLLSQPKKNPEKGNTVDKYITKIRIENSGIPSFNYSEGHKKLILIECITKLLGDENSLILLDEPDAHTHIAMKKDILKQISEFEGQTIMTTHSPMFLNKRWKGYNDNNIFYMHDGKIEDTEPLKNLAELTDNEIDYFEGSFILSSKKILVTEGPYDILYLKHAIEKFADENPKYIKLREQVAFMHAGGANNASALYQQTLFPLINKIENLVFIFDYDKEGFKGAEELRKSMTSYNDVKTVLLFYQDNYSTHKTREPNDKDTESYMVEDLFDISAYTQVSNKIHAINSHKEFRNMTWSDVIKSNKRIKGTHEVIKYYIQENYSSFGKEWLQNFKPVLDKLLNVFNLN